MKVIDCNNARLKPEIKKDITMLFAILRTRLKCLKNRLFRVAHHVDNFVFTTQEFNAV